MINLEKKEQILVFLRAGDSARQTAKKLHCRQTTVLEIGREAGIEILTPAKQLERLRKEADPEIAAKIAAGQKRGLEKIRTDPEIAAKIAAGQKRGIEKMNGDPEVIARRAAGTRRFFTAPKDLKKYTKEMARRRKPKIDPRKEKIAVAVLGRGATQKEAAKQAGISRKCALMINKRNADTISTELSKRGLGEFISKPIRPPQKIGRPPKRVICHTPKNG